MKKSFRLFLPVAALLALCACNKEEIILDTTIQIPSQAGDADIAYPQGLHVYEYTPAPGQFIGDASLGGMPEMPSTMQEACDWAEKRMNQSLFVSLGAFGGYIVMGLDDGFDNGEGCDFAVAGNAFLNSGSASGGSNEPGIVYVMEDSNNNGLPDDVWFELRGSDSSDASSVRDYAVTYRRPSQPNSPVEWTDNLGASGQIEHLSLIHRQPFYWPAWIDVDSYTLSGTLLSSRPSLDASGRWDNSPLAWGYADNMGADIFVGLAGQWVAFDISNAIDASGRPANIRHAHFIKVQTGVNGAAGPLGEVSTEVCGLSKI